MWYYKLTDKYTYDIDPKGELFDDETRTCKCKVPGCKRDTFKLTLTGEELEVQYVDGKLSKKVLFLLPDDTDLTQVSASLEDGVLTIHCPQLESAKPRTIALK